jgi:Flp pilus assembly protein CpaB
VDLLYPGCIVDVFATFPLRDREKGDAVVTPLLQNIQVLAIASDTVLPPATDEKGKAVVDKAASSRSRPGGNVTVTLEVTARQAAALQLALENGTLGLAMRNPNDKGWNPMEPMVVKEGQLTASSEALDPATLAWVTSIQRMLNPDMAPPARPVTATTGPEATAADPNRVPDVLAIPGIQFQKSTMQITVIRGPEVTETEIEAGTTEQPTTEEPVKDGAGV